MEYRKAKLYETSSHRRLRTRISRIGGVLALFAVAACFYEIYRYNLFLDDDYLFYVFTGTDRPITGFWDAVHSQAVAYMTWNGRFTIHTLVQLFCAVWGKAAFAVVHTGFFLLFFWLMFKHTQTLSLNRWYKGILLLMAIWLFIPSLGVSYLGNIAFGINYLGSSVVFLAFLWLIRDLSWVKPGILSTLGLILTGLIVGSFQESFSVGLAGAYLIYYILHPRSFEGAKRYLLLGFWLGTLLLLIAPGNFNRMLETQDIQKVDGLKMLLLTKWSILRSIFRDIPILSLLGLVLLAKLMVTPSKGKAFIQSNQLFLMAIAINILFALIIAYMGPWQCTSSALFAILILANTISIKRSPGKRWILNFTAAFSLIFMSITYVNALNIRKQLYEEHETFVQEALKTKTGIACSRYEVVGRQIQRKYGFMEHYFRLVFYMGDAYHKRLLSLYLTKGKDPNHVRCVLPYSPENIRAFCVPSNRLKPNSDWYKTDAGDFIILQSGHKPNRNRIIKASKTDFFETICINGTYYTILSTPKHSFL